MKKLEILVDKEFTQEDVVDLWWLVKKEESPKYQVIKKFEVDNIKVTLALDDVISDERGIPIEFYAEDTLAMNTRKTLEDYYSRSLTIGVCEGGTTVMRDVPVSFMFHSKVYFRDSVRGQILIGIKELKAKKRKNNCGD